MTSHNTPTGDPAFPVRHDLTRLGLRKPTLPPPPPTLAETFQAVARISHDMAEAFKQRPARFTAGVALTDTVLRQRETP